MNIIPTISVILPVYNCELYISDTLESILIQTYQNFEIIIVDDKSNDKTLEILNTFLDNRIIVITKENNTGYTDSLNLGIKLARGKYIARMDGDDICYPQRFEKQLNFLDNNADVVALGTAYELLHNGYKFYPAKDHNEIELDLLVGNIFCHPSMVIRKDILLRNNLFYDRNYEPAEDYKLWIDLLAFGKLANLEDVLLKYRLHDKQISSTEREKQNMIKKRIRKEYLLKNNIDIQVSEKHGYLFFWIKLFFYNLKFVRFRNRLIFVRIFRSVKKAFNKSF